MNRNYQNVMDRTITIREICTNWCAVKNNGWCVNYSPSCASNPSLSTCATSNASTPPASPCSSLSTERRAWPDTSSQSSMHRHRVVEILQLVGLDRILISHDARNVTLALPGENLLRDAGRVNQRGPSRGAMPVARSFED